MSVARQRAKEFADLGYNVFPVHNKLPILKSWPDKATRDHDIIDEWYDGFASTANGFGVCPKDTCVVIDVDVKDGKGGAAALKWLIDEFDLSKNTQIIRTTSGGLHLYYKYPELLSGEHIKSIANWNVNGRILDGIDIRGNRGQVVGPCENGYSIIKQLPASGLADLPMALIEALPVDRVSGLKKVRGDDAQALVSYEDESLKGVIPDIIAEGTRHQVLLSLTASWARKVPYDTAKVLLREAINRCEGTDTQYDDYLERLDDAYDKFEPVIEDRVQWMLDHLVYVVGSNSVYRLDKPGNSATIDMPSAANFYRNWKVFIEKEDKEGNVKITSKKAFDMWMEHPDRQSVENVGYKPSDEQFYLSESMGDTLINSYRAPEMGQSEDEVQWFTDLVKFLWQEEAEVILDLCAHLLQNPTDKVHWCPLLISEYEGMGKNIFYEILSKCVGKWNASIVNAALLSKTFNTFLLQNRIILVNEVQEISKRDRQTVVSKLKSYITESVQSIEGKGTNAFVTDTFCNFFIFSNKTDAIDIDANSRRFHVYINKLKPRSQSWYTELVSNMDSAGIDAVHNFLMTRDISKFNANGHAPSTDSKDEVVKSNMSEYQTEISQHIEFGTSIFESDIVTDESWQYYVNHVLHKGGRMSVAQEKYLKKELLTRIKNASGGSRQIRVQYISKISDDTAVIRGVATVRCLAYSIRNHESYVNCTASVIKDEYDTIFTDKANKIKAVK